MSALDLFTYEGQQVRTVVVDGSPWFVSADVLTVLDLNRSSVATLDDDERGVHSVDTPSGAQQMSVLNEPGLYSLILRSRKPEAKPFKRWITHEVLPAVRKTGSYGQTNVDQIPRATLAQMILDSEAEKAAAIEQRDAAETLAAEREIPARAWDELASAEGDYSVGDAAKVLASRGGVTTGQQRLFEYLNAKGWTYRREGDWHAKQEAIERGYLSHRVRPPRYDQRTGERVAVSPQVRVTGKGLERLFKDMSTTSREVAW